MTDVLETLLTATVCVLPGTDARELAQVLADAVAHLPVPAAIGIGVTEVPPDILARSRALAERQGMYSDAASDLLHYAARLWHEPGDAFPADPERVQVAVALRVLWEQRVRGERSGLMKITVMPSNLFVTNEQWLTLARSCPWFALTADAPAGLVPGR